MDIPTNVAARVRELIEATITGVNTNNMEAAALQEKRASITGGWILAAIAAESAEVFADVCDKLFDDIRANVDGVAVRAKCREADKKGENGETLYQVSQSIRDAKGFVKASFELDVALQDDEGEPVSFGALRKAVKQAKAVKAEANTTDLQKTQAICLSKLGYIQTQIGKVDCSPENSVQVQEAAATVIADVTSVLDIALNAVAELVKGYVVAQTTAATLDAEIQAAMEAASDEMSAELGDNDVEADYYTDAEAEAAAELEAEAEALEKAIDAKREKKNAAARARRAAKKAA